jgi:phospholipid/cholesterol/gamma-HCH transport system ATP-binding protein
LDPIATDSINHLIRRLQKRLQVTSVVVTHDMKTAFHTADRIIFLHEGRVYFEGTPDALHASADPVLQDFVEGRSGESD